MNPKMLTPNPSIRPINPCFIRAFRPTTSIVKGHLLINTLLQQGVRSRWSSENRFNGFYQARKTVEIETVMRSAATGPTALK